jgi:hypothetical protein
MQAYQENISAKIGGVLSPVLGVQVTVTDKATGNPAALYSDNGVTAIKQPLVTDETGYFGFYAANGNYTVAFSSPQIALAPRVVQLYDPADDVPLTQAQAAAASGASKVGFRQAGGTSRSVENKLGDTVSVKDFGAVGDGVADDTAAMQAATNTGKTVFFPEGVYKMLGAVTYSGCVRWKGSGVLSRILNDDSILVVTNGAGSTVDNLDAVNITAPWIIYRDPDNWSAVPVPVQSNGDGYQPTINDQDIWATLTAAQKNQDIGPKFLIHGDSNIRVSRITGRFVTVWVYDAVRSVIRDCNFRAGKNVNAGIMFWNVDGQIGYGNKIVDNVVTWPSFSGVSMARNYDGSMEGNIVEHAGESGLKTCQNFSNGVIDLRCRRLLISGNKTRYCYYDGLDVSSDYPHTGTLDVGHRILNNDTYKNRQTGFYGDGKYVKFSGNSARECGLAGIELFYNNCKISENLVDNCNTVNLAQVNQFSLTGDNNVLSTNVTRRVVASGYGIYAPGNNINFLNFAQGCANFLGATAATKAVNEGNVDTVTGLKTIQSFQFVLFNNGGTIQHLFKSENVIGVYGALAARINASNGNLTASPTGADATTAFAGGAKISSANTNVILFDTADQDVVTFQGLATIEQNQSGTPLLVQVGLYNSSVNGVTQTRLGLAFFNATTGAAFPITAANLAAGKAICARFHGRVA